MLDLIGIFLSTYLAYFFVLFFLILLFIEKDRRQRISNLLFAVLSVLFSYGVVKLALNYFFFRPRPFAALNFTPLVPHDLDASFPSGHAVFYFTLATVAYLVISRRWGIWFGLAAAAMGIARIYIGVHWPSDILVGAAIGIVSPFLIRLFMPQKTEAGIMN